MSNETRQEAVVILSYATASLRAACCDDKVAVVEVIGRLATWDRPLMPYVACAWVDVVQTVRLTLGMSMVNVALTSESDNHPLHLWAQQFIDVLMGSPQAAKHWQKLWGELEPEHHVRALLTLLDMCSSLIVEMSPSPERDNLRAKGLN